MWYKNLLQVKLMNENIFIIIIILFMFVSLITKLAVPATPSAWNSEIAWYLL